MAVSISRANMMKGCEVWTWEFGHVGYIFEGFSRISSVVSVGGVILGIGTQCINYILDSLLKFNMIQNSKSFIFR